MTKVMFKLNSRESRSSACLPPSLHALQNKDLWLLQFSSCLGAGYHCPDIKPVPEHAFKPGHPQNGEKVGKKQ